MNHVLNVNNLCKSFPTPAGAVLEVLRGVSFSAAGGELVAITGASGAGKSTLLQLLGGLDTPDAGAIALDQTEIAGATRRQLSDLRASSIGSGVVREP